MLRSELLQEFLDKSLEAFKLLAPDSQSKASIWRIEDALESAFEMSDDVPERLPVCKHLAYAADPSRFSDPTLRMVVDSFMRLEPSLNWWRRKGPCPSASENFADGHGNATIIGSNGIERRNDVTIGVSLVAPHVRYPDHNHLPEETYLVLSRGEFRQGDAAWFEPGIGGTLYNSSNITHAMRSGQEPLFALWALYAG